MSWNITGVGSKAALKKHATNYLDGCIASCGGQPLFESEYTAAKAALLGLIDSAPDGHLLQIESSGSASHGDYPYFNAKIEIKLLAPTLKE